MRILDSIRRAIPRSGLIVFALLASSSMSLAQSGAPPASLDSNAKEGADKVEATAQSIVSSGPATSATFGGLTRAFQIQTDGNDTNATLALSFDRSHQLGDARPLDGGATRRTFATDTFGLTASAPLGKGGKPSVFSFDSLGDGTELSFSAARYVGSVDYLPASSPDSLPAFQERLENRCVDAKSAVWIVTEADGDPTKEALARLVATDLRTRLDRLKLERGMRTGLALAEIKRTGDERLVALATSVRTDCVENDGGGLLANYGTDDEKRQGAPGEPRSIRFFGFSGTVSRQNFAFVTQSPLAPGDVSHTAYRLRAFGGSIFGSGRQSITGSFSYALKYKPQDEVTLCGPTTIVGQTQCFTGPLGPPALVNRYTIAAEYRQMFKLDSLPGGPTIGIAPKISYEFQTDAVVLELPIYFVPSKDGKLNGGLLTAYNTSTDDFAIGLFVGVPFSIFTN